MKNTTFVLILVFSIALSVLCNAQTDIQKIKEKVVKELMKPEVDDSGIEMLIETLREDGTWPGINYKDVSRTAFEHRNHSAYLVSLARAYKSKTSGFYKKKKVKETVIKALSFWAENDFFCDNWWHNQIGTPSSMVNLMLIMGDELPEDLVEKMQPIIGRAHLNASGARPSGDRIKIAGILAKNLLFIGDKEQFEEVITVIESEIKFVTGRGMQYDFSFHHRVDKVNNTISYGLGYANAFAEWAAYVAGTEYAFSDEKIQHLTDYYLDGICKNMVFGKYPDIGTKNRSISRKGALKPHGTTSLERLLQTTDYRKNELKEIIDIRNNSANPTLSHATFYWHSEHFTFQRPGYFTSVRMYSTRNHNMEVPYNSEGLLNHHRGDGTNHISLIGDEYYDIAPVFDYQKISGTTILQKPEMPSEHEIQQPGLTDFVGAVTDGRYGAAAFDFKSPHDPLVAKKSWFFFDEEYVCLGAGINCISDLPVATTLNQCLLRDDVVIMSNNQKSQLKKGEHELSGVNWIFHDGVGYLFPEKVNVNLNNTSASGSWYKINRQTDSPKDEINLDVLKIWLDHGPQPSNVTYQYIIVPSTSEQEMENSSSIRNIEILANTPELQAVKNSALNITQVVFYKAGEISVSENIKLSCDSPGIIMVKTNKGKVTEISVSDPNRELGKMHLSVSAKVEKEGENFKSVWNEEEKISEISIDLPKDVYAGKSVSFKL